MTCSLAFPARALLGLGLGLATPAPAEDFKFDPSGRASAFVRQTQIKATDLVPNPGTHGDADSQSGADLALLGKARLGALKFASQMRLTAETGKDATALLDEAYGEWGASDQFFIAIGRRNLTYGQAYGLNPSDMFRVPLNENHIFPSEKSRRDVKGSDMLSADLLFENSASLQFVYALKEPARYAVKPFWMLRYSRILAGGALDYALSAFGGSRPGIGTTTSLGVSEALVVYVDATLRRGRDRQTVKGLGSTGVLQVNPLDRTILQPFVTVGMGHSFASGLALNVELSHDANGQNAGEWERTAASLQRLTPVTSAQSGAALGQLNSTLNHYTQRQNYGFARLSKENLFGAELTGEFTVLHGFDSNSGALGLRLEHGLTDNARLGLHATQPYGHAKGEYKLRPNRSSLSLYTMVTF